MFSGSLSDLSESDLEQLKLDGLPSSTLPRAQVDGRGPFMALSIAE